MKSLQRVLPDSLFIHSSSSLVIFACSFSESSGNVVIASSRISSSILRFHACAGSRRGAGAKERRRERVQSGVQKKLVGIGLRLSRNGTHLVSLRSRGATFSSKFQYVYPPKRKAQQSREPRT